MSQTLPNVELEQRLVGHVSTGRGLLERCERVLGYLDRHRVCFAGTKLQFKFLFQFFFRFIYPIFTSAFPLTLIRSVMHHLTKYRL